MHIHELVLEITRRCNIQCLRGKAQAKDMAYETLHKALIGVDSIGTVTFTGGEPSLNVPFIRMFTDYVRNHKINIQGFYVVTNGKIASRSLKDALVRLSWICDDPKEYCDLVMSQDQFHKELGYSQWRAKDLYEDLEFFHCDKRARPIEFVIDEGLAFENGLGVRSADINHPVITRDEENVPDGIEGTIYVNVLGDVIPGCDMSYDNQKLEKIGNVYVKPIIDIITEYERTLKEVA
jgi:MoaA/NifB/PqqE/SkfB family radical SAM enzyme